MSAISWATDFPMNHGFYTAVKKVLRAADDIINMTYRDGGII